MLDPLANKLARVLMVLLFAGACGPDDGPTEPVEEPRATTLELSPDTVSFRALGDTARLIATVRDQNGADLPSPTLTWSSGEPAVASVDANGLVAAVANGVATISAVSGAATGLAQVIVDQRAATVTVSPTTDTLFTAGDTVRLVAVAMDSLGVEVELRTFTWRSSDESIATVDSSGLATAVGPNGEATIMAAAAGGTGSAVLEVLTGPQGGTVLAADGQVRIEVPEGAVSEPLRITVEAATSVPSPDRVASNAVFDLGPDGTRFLSPVQVSVGYDGGDVPPGVSESDLRLHRLDGDTWVALPGSTVDLTGKVVTGATSSFSTYAIVGAVEGSAVLSVTISGPSLLELGQDHAFDLVVTNVGTALSIYSYALVQMPASLDHVVHAPLGLLPAEPPPTDPNGELARLVVGLSPIVPGASTSVPLTLTPNAIGTLVLEAGIRSAEDAAASSQGRGRDAGGDVRVLSSQGEPDLAIYPPHWDWEKLPRPPPGYIVLYDRFCVGNECFASTAISLGDGLVAHMLPGGLHIHRLDFARPKHVMRPNNWSPQKGEQFKADFYSKWEQRNDGIYYDDEKTEYVPGLDSEFPRTFCSKAVEYLWRDLMDLTGGTLFDATGGVYHKLYRYWRELGFDEAYDWTPAERNVLEDIYLDLYRLLFDLLNPVKTVRFDPTFVQIGFVSGSSSPSHDPVSRRHLTVRDPALSGGIAFPPPGAMVRAEVPVFGFASGADFERYTVEYGAGEEPDHWEVLASSTVPQDSLAGFSGLQSSTDFAVHGNLATWDVGLKHYVYLPSHPRDHPVDLKGTYTLRLVVTGKDGTRIEDRVTVFVADVFTNAWGGTGGSPDGMMSISVPDHGLRESVRLIGFEAVDKAPPPPQGRAFIGSVYRAREAGDVFTRAAVVKLRLPASDRGAAARGVGLYGYDSDQLRWRRLPANDQTSDSLLAATVRRLHAYYAAIDVDSVEGSAPPTTVVSVEDHSSGPKRRSPHGGPHVMRQTFEDGAGTWRNRGGTSGAALSLETREAGGQALKLVNPEGGGSFAVTVLDQAFDARTHPVMEFDYRIEPDVKTDFYARVGDRWFNIGFTDDPQDFSYKRVNVASAGWIDAVVTDGRWHTVRFDIWDLLRTKTGESVVQELVMADWDLGGLMQLGFGSNAPGATYWIDNFSIGRDDATEAPAGGGPLRIDDFEGSQTPNAFGKPTGVFTDGSLGSMRTRVSDDHLLGRSLELVYDVAREGAFAGYLSGLPHLDLRGHRLLRFVVRGEAEILDARVGIRDAAGVESMVRLGDFVSPSSGGDAAHVAIPLVAFSSNVDWSDVVEVSLSMQAPTASRGRLVVDELEFVRPLDSVWVDRFERDEQRNLLGGPHYTYMSPEAAATRWIASEGDDRYLRVVFGGAIPWGYAGWRTDLPGLDCSGCRAIALRIRGARGGERPNLYLNDGTHRWPVDLERYVAVTTEWRDVFVPLSAFAAEGVDLSHLEAVELVFEWEEMSGAIYVDDIRFVGARHAPAGR